MWQLARLMWSCGGCAATVLTRAVVLSRCSSMNGACTQCGDSAGAYVARRKALGQSVVKRDSMHTVIQRPVSAADHAFDRACL